MTTGVGVQPEQIDATPGDPVVLTVSVANHLPTASLFQIRVVGADTDWSGAPQITPLLEPGAHSSLELTVTLPLGFPAGEHLLGVEVVPLTPQGTPSPDQRQRRVADVVVSVGSLSGLHAVLEPRTIYGRRRAKVQRTNVSTMLRGGGVRRARGGQATVSLRNRSFEPIQVSLTASSPGDEVAVSFDRSEMVVPPGHVVPVRAKVRGTRPLWGQPRRTPFTVAAKGTGNPVYLEGSYYRHARIRPGAIKGLGILTVLALWASTLVVVYDRVTQSDDPEQATAQQASDVADTAGAGNGADVAGDGQESGGIQDLSLTPASVEASGKVTAREPNGVRVRIRSVSLVDEISQDATFQASPRSATSRGVKLFGRRGGVLNNRVVPAEVATTTDDEGRWAVGGLEGPGFFEIRFSKAGYATRAYVVEFPEDGSPIVVDTELEAGDGGISGIVSGPDGPLGGVNITVTDGTVTLTTTTPTTGNVGQWSVDGLTTPGSYLVTATRYGYGTATQLVRLGGGQTVNGVQMQMRPGTGAITGTVRSPAGPMGDITITAIDGDVVRTTTSLTEGPVGTFSLTDLPSPGNYTLTVEGEGYLSQTRDVALTGDETSVAIELTARTGIVYGRITDTAGQALGGVGITAISEDHQYKSTTAPDGRFELVGLEPGSYVIEFFSFEHHTGSSLITIGSGGLREVNLSLAPRDTLEPPPNNSLTFSFSAEGAITVTERTTGATASTGGGASASFTNLPAGMRTFDITGVGFQPAVVQFRMGLNGPFSTSVTLRPLVIVDLEIRARLGGAPLQGADVVIRRNDPATCPPTNVSPGCEPFRGTSDADGKVFDALGKPPELTDGPWIALATRTGYAPGDGTFSTSYDTSPLTSAEVFLDKLGEIRLSVREPNLTDPISFNFLDGVTVTLLGGPDDGRVFPGVVSGQEVTNPYLLEGIEPGEYRLRLEKPGYRTIVHPPADQQPLDVPVNSSLQESVLMVVVPDGTFGTVVWDRNGSPDPVPGARVRIRGVATFDAGATPPTPVLDTWTTVTDESGQFSFEGDDGPIFGNATVTVDYPSWTAWYPANAFVSDTFEVESNTDVGDLELAARPGSLFLETRLFFGDSPPPLDEQRPDRIRVDVVDGPAGPSTQPYLPWFSSQSSGNNSYAWFYVQNLPAGDYDLRVWYDPVDANDENRFTPVYLDDVFVPPFDIAWAGSATLVAQGRISGSVFEVIDPGDLDDEFFQPSPLGGATVTLLDDEGNLVTEVEGPNPVELGPNQSTFTFNALDAPGPYHLEVALDGYTTRLLPSPDPITLSPGQRRDGVQLYLRPLASVTGTLIGDPVVGDQAPIAGATVTAVQENVTFQPVQTGNDGSFTITGLDRGPVLIEIDAGDQGYHNVSIDLSDESDDGEPLDWAEQRDLGEIVTEILPSTLRFSVTSSGQNVELQDLVIELYRHGEPTPTASLADGDFEWDQAEGQYVLAGLPPGTYRLELNAHNHAPLSVPDTGNGFLLQPGQDTELEIVLVNQLSSLIGTVTLTVGSGQYAELQDASAVLVELLDAAGDPVIGDDGKPIQTTTAPDGSYRFDDLEDGSYRLRWSKDGFGDHILSEATLVDPRLEKDERVVAVGNITLQALTREVIVTVQSAVDDEPIEDATVKLVVDTSFPGNTAMETDSEPTDDNGTAVFENVVPGRYRIVVDASNTPHLDADVPYPLAIDDIANLELDPVVTVEETLLSGWVSISGAGPVTLNGALVEVFDDATGGSKVDEFAFDGAVGSLAEFSLYLAPSALYRVRVSVPSSPEYLPVEIGGITELATAGGKHAVSTDTAPLALVQSATVTVRIEERGTGRPIDGATIEYRDPVLNTAIRVRDGEAGDADGWANGVVELVGLTPGTYRFEVIGGTGYDGVAGDTVQLSSGPNTGITLTPLAHGSLEVEVSGATGGQDFQARLIPDDGGPVSTVDLRNNQQASRTIDRVRTGYYRVEVCWPSFDTCNYEGSHAQVDITRGGQIKVTIIVTSTTTTTTAP
jgi:large repetitive protein